MVVNETENKKLDHTISVIKKISEYCHLQTDEAKLNRAPETKTAFNLINTFFKTIVPD